MEYISTFFQEIFRCNTNKYFSELHTKGLTVVALDLNSLKELTKDNLCESVTNCSSAKSGRVDTKLDTANGDLHEDYLPSPKTLKANVSIESSHDMAQLQNYLDIIEKSLASNVEMPEPKQVSNHLKSFNGGKKLC